MKQMKKIPKYLQKPPQVWFDHYGLKRACAVLDIQASIERKNGNKEAYDALRKVSLALKATYRKVEPIAESVTLDWPVNLPH